MLDHSLGGVFYRFIVDRVSQTCDGEHKPSNTLRGYGLVRMDRVKRVGVFALALALILNIVLTGFLYVSVSDANDRISDLEDEMDVIAEYLLQTGQHDSATDSEGETVEQQTGNMVAYDTKEDSGIIFEYNYQPLPGDGIYIDASDVTVENSFQESLQNAQTAVEGTDYEPRTTGVALSFDTPEYWEYVSGESAGLAIAAHIASTDPDYELNESAVLTGQVEEGGNVVSVDHVSSKGEAAGAEGKDVIIAPHSYASVNAEGIDVVHVQSVEEALDYALDPVDDPDSNSE